MLEEIQAKAAYVEERIKQLEQHTEIRDNLAPKYRLENETISKSWINANKEKKPQDTINPLRILESPVDQPSYTKEMANLTKSYHENLQTEYLSNDVSEADFDEVLSFLKPKLSQHDKKKLSTYLTWTKIKQALKDLPDGKAASIDGIPHELWKALLTRFKNNRQANAPKFDIIKCLTLVYNDIEQYGVSLPTEFHQEKGVWSLRNLGISS